MSIPLPAPKRDRGRMVLIAVLAASLLLNALAAGAALRAYRLRSELLGPDAVAVFFSRDTRRDISRALARSADPLRAALRDAALARKAVVDTAETRPFDRAATAAAMETFRARANEALALTQGVILDTLEARAAQGR